MTKPGYTHIIVPQTLHDQLKTLAQQNNLSINQLIAQLVSINVNVNVGVSINTGINTTQLTTQKQSLPQASNPQNNLKQSSFNKTHFFGEAFCEQKGSMVRPPRFEPGSSAWQADVLDQTRLRPHVSNAKGHFAEVPIFLF